MANPTDTANVIIRPPIAWVVAVLAGLALNRLIPLPFVPAVVPGGWVGAIVFALALALLVWAIATITRAGSNVRTTFEGRGSWKRSRHRLAVALRVVCSLRSPFHTEMRSPS